MLRGGGRVGRRADLVRQRRQNERHGRSEATSDRRPSAGCPAFQGGATLAFAVACDAPRLVEVEHHADVAWQR